MSHQYCVVKHQTAVVTQELKSNLLILCAGIFDLIKSASYNWVSIASHEINKMRLFDSITNDQRQCVDQTLSWLFSLPQAV